MLSRQIDLSNFHIERAENAKDQRRAANYRDQIRRHPFPKKLRSATLALLKKHLADFKTHHDHDAKESIGVAGLFGMERLSQTAALERGISKLDPSAEVARLYHKLIDKLVTIAKDGIQKTTFTLDSAAFGSSIFRGSSITIIEYSTAPKIFNIQLAADPKAIAFFAPHAAHLQHALNSKSHRFEVGRIDAHLLAYKNKQAIEPLGDDPRDDGHE